MEKRNKSRSGDAKDSGPDEQAGKSDNAGASEQAVTESKPADSGNGGVHLGEASGAAERVISESAGQILTVAVQTADDLRGLAEISTAISDNSPSESDLRAAILFTFPSDWSVPIKAMIDRMFVDDLINLLSLLCLQYKLGYEGAMALVRQAAAQQKRRR